MLLEQRGSAASLVHSREVPPDPKRCSEPACFKTPGIGVWKVAPAEKRERLLKSDGWTFEQFAVWDPQREPVGDVVRRGDARQAVRFDARDLWFA